MIFKGFFVVGIGENRVELYRKLHCCGAWSMQRVSEDWFHCRCGEATINANELLNALRSPPAVANVPDMPTPTTNGTTKPKPKGFAAMRPELQLKLCAKGGKSTARKHGSCYMANLGRRGRAVRTRNEKAAKRTKIVA